MAILVVTYDSATGRYLTQKLGSAQIGDGAITSGLLASGIIGTVHLRDLNVTSAKLAAALITTIEAGGVGDAAITSAKIASGAVGTVHMWPGAVASAIIASGVIGGVHIYSGSIPGLDLENAAITSSKIASGIVGIPHLQAWASGKILVGQGPTTTPVTKDNMATIEFVIDGLGSAIASGPHGHLEVTFPGTINSVRLLADASGMIGIDIRKGTYAGFEGIAATNSICSGLRPILSSVMKYQDTALTGWDTKILSGDVLVYAVDRGISSITKLTVSLGVYK